MANLSQLSNGVRTEQEVGKGIKMVDMNTYVSSALVLSRKKLTNHSHRLFFS